MSPEVSPPNEQADARASEARWKLAFEANSDGVWDWDIPSGRVDFSDGFETMLGFAAATPWRNVSDWADRVHPDDLPNAMATVQAHLDGRTASYTREHRIRCADNTWKWVLDRGLARFEQIHAVPRGTLTSATTFYDDVFADPSERASTRDRVLADIASGDRNRLRWDDVSLTTGSGERRWITAVNIPLPEQQLMVSTVQDVTHTHLAAEALERQTDHLRERNADLLRFNRAAVDRELRVIELAVEDLPAAVAAPGVIRQVWINLLGNALKFTGTLSAARIEVGGHTANGATMYFVRDNGVGFDMKYGGKLFGVFQRLHASADFEGTGVGLALAQRIVSRHGGRIWAEGAVDRGATFSFSLPVVAVPAA